ncbi:DUF1656 domain-containing protein [Vibrio ulleungensis]|uniref:DUF1656 domain-containing protein n=1 Tax=Vibrio ulleungensis TaxID=2807619 RepID=A0ABS2HGW1_9VIBR|nr:DUF1656 domain-containing protein [Vibrio ulleungensis]MBM7035309.1 DUF1656 domain-containing protein [Vibrio ulleungensis]
MYTMPHEMVWGEVYFPPLLLVVALAYLATVTVGILVTKFGLHKYVGFPAIAEISLIIILVGIIGQFITIV